MIKVILKKPKIKVVLRSKAAAPSRKRFITGTICPECDETDRLWLVSAISTMKPPQLRVTYECLNCGHAWTKTSPRKDVCPHGKIMIVPCTTCGRTWEWIESPEGREALSKGYEA